MKKEILGRIVGIDIIRGYFLFVILVDHLGRTFSGYDFFTGGGQQWVSAAEGFFFVSGVMIGLIRGRKLRDQPFSITVKKLLERSFQLYIWAIGLTLLFTLIAHLFITNSGLKTGFFQNEPLWKLLTHTVTLRYNYGWADFLNYYAIYLLLSPLAILLLRTKKWYVLLLINFITWILADNVQFAWQLLFFGGAIAGYYLPEIEYWFNNLKKKTQRYIYIIITTLGVTTIATSIFFNMVIDVMNRPASKFNILGSLTVRLYDFNTYFLANYFDKYTLGYGRLILFVIWFSMLYLLVRRYETLIAKYLGWFFIPLGQNSLYVYIMHAIVLFLLNLVLPVQLPIWLNVVANTAFLGFIWILVKTKFLFKIIPR